jgi:hypothetical protein
MSVRKLTRPECDLIELAMQTEDGNPWPLVGMRQRAGGAKSRMFDRLRREGVFDRDNCLTIEGRRRWLNDAAGQRISIGCRTVRRMLHYPVPVNDDTYRCITCGQPDDQPWHHDYVCRSAKIVIFESAAA